MSLRRCPSCKNLFNVQSICCPICGCEPTKKYVARVIKWSIVLLALGWLTQHYISKNQSPPREGHATPALISNHPL